MLTIRAMSDGAGYSEKHLEHNDYYCENERVIGRWRGRGAAMLGLDGPVGQKDFEAVRQGVHPANGAFLRPRHSADRAAKDGSVQSHGRHLYDLTLSAPKSVSIMAVVGDDTRLIAAHEKAVEEALDEIERHAAARVRTSGANHDRVTGNLVVAAYTHDASRELDPQLHTHAVAANLTFDGAEGRWKALQASGIYERSRYLTEVYRNALAREVMALGYQIENRVDNKGNDRGFEIHGVPESLIEKFSQRSRQRDEAIAAFAKENGRAPTKNEIAMMVRDTRQDKLAEASTEQVRRAQRDRMEPGEINLLMELKSRSVPEPVKTLPPEPFLNYAKGHVFERVSVARDHEILAEALRGGRGKIDLRETKDALMAQERNGDVLRSGNEIATRESLGREMEMIGWVNRHIGTARAIDEQKAFAPDARLNAEQRNAVAFALGSRDQAVCISGAAGTGKTTMLQELGRSIRESGHDVLAIAPTRSAVEELQRVGFDDAVTIERLLHDPRAQRHGCVLIVDEAGMVSSRQMSELLKLSDRRSYRLILSGDTKQIQSVEAGDALRVLQKESRLKTVSLVGERRQTTKDYRNAVHLLRTNPAKGLDRLDGMGAVMEVPGPERAEAVARAFADFAKRKLDPIVVCATHDEIGRVTDAIRRDRRAAGELGDEYELKRDVPLNWTAAHKADVSRLRQGQILGFHRAVGGIERNESVEVVAVGKDHATVRNGRGETRLVTGRHAKSFDVYERQAIGVAAGDRLLLTANRRAAGFSCTNGEIVTVSGIDGQGKIHLRDGRTLPKGYTHFLHGYAVTAHRSQGKTAGAVVISADGMRQELFYVAVSRGREGIAVVTGDKERLRTTIGCSTARKSATELARDLRPGLRQGANRGMAAARSLAGWAARQVSLLVGPVPLLRKELEAIKEPQTTRGLDYGR